MHRYLLEHVNNNRTYMDMAPLLSKLAIREVGSTS